MSVTRGVGDPISFHDHPPHEAIRTPKRTFDTATPRTNFRQISRVASSEIGRHDWPATPGVIIAGESFAWDGPVGWPGNLVGFNSPLNSASPLGSQKFHRLPPRSTQVTSKLGVMVNHLLVPTNNPIQGGDYRAPQPDCCQTMTPLAAV